MKTLEVVALIDDVPEKHLRRGQVGTVVESQWTGWPNVRGISGLMTVEYAGQTSRQCQTLPKNKKEKGQRQE